MMRTRRILRAMTAVVALLSSGAAAAQETRTLYRATLVQAAPGRLLDLIALCKSKEKSDVKAGDEPSLMIRHSQGDKWDLLLLAPMGSYAEYYTPNRIALREDSYRGARTLSAAANPLIAWQEDVFVYGPPLDELKTAFVKGAFYHVEMMQALPGRLSSLRKEREMENEYSKKLDRPQNFIFVRDQGAAWDLFTIGVYRDLKHYAESADIPVKLQEEAAKLAGFESASAIGPYLRTLIRTHHDTLGVAVK
ncbi:MAG: hypothetical protein HY234_04650 [Acidobacteria bacterium]|nr:hypothetical protein [Acidobacteriota bacterium]